MSTGLAARGWKVLKRVGGGRFSDVYLMSNPAQEGFEEKLYAVKVADPDDLRPPHNLRNEIKILKDLENVTNGNSDNVIRLIEVYVYGPEVSLVFEYYDLTLKQLLHSNIKKKTLFNPDGTMTTRTENKMELATVRQLMRGIFKGLYWIHQCGIIHRDINLNNILLSSKDKNTPVIIDFGIAYEEPNNNGLESPDRKFTDIATGIFKAPELLLSKRDYTNKVDMWAAGIILSILVSEKGESFFELDSQYSDLVLLSNILKVFGSPPIDWSDCKGLDSFESLNSTFFKKQAKSLSEFLPRIEQATDLKTLFEGLTQYETKQRFSAEQCLELLG
ncbi:hypothetical protein CANINC_002427 [Pichia inconspicua]|uniref:Protein kinase domain-containing protein n=1 Tax=Pichia inconspicua TaxID=52247 RepID=A0A4T0X1B3_9ASCO|nr:hypothetical protein CANINC_002427 [[Candida] inconspicua]